MIEYKIYGLKDPIDNIIKYVGISKNIYSRYKQHLYSKIGSKSDWIEELNKLDLRPEIIILDTITTSDRNEALNKEKEYIREYKNTIYNIHGKDIENTQETKWTTLSVEKELKPTLDKVMLKMQEKLTYNEIIKRLTIEYLKN